MTALLLKFAPYIAAFLIACGAGAYVTHKIDSVSLGRVQNAFDAYKLDVSKASADAQAAFAKAQQAQVTQRTTIEANNAKVIQQLQDQAVSAATDRDFARRLLAAAASQTKSANPVVPKAADQPAVLDAPSAPGSRPAVDLPGLTADAIAECRGAFEFAYGYAAEMIPQL